MKNANDILSKYGLSNISSCSKINQGEINETFLATTTGGEKYILQKIKFMAPFAKNILSFHKVAEEWTKNYDIVGSVLSGHGFASGAPLKIKKENNYVFRSGDNSLWRVFNYIDHDDISLLDEKDAHSAGKALGTFHRLPGLINYKPAFPIPGFHKTAKIIERLENVFSKNKNKAKLVNDEYLFLREKVKEYYLPENLPETVLHGDPKINNFLFKGGKVVGIIDLDTIMTGNIYLDIGDALRSWCEVTNNFSKGIFFSSLQGYQEGARKKINTDLAIRSARLITLELAARYLIDYFEESYFAWDSKNYENAAEHNLARAKYWIDYFHAINI
jgi:thiamine kinase-like enzyme